jgi:hypothetical protein
MSSELAEYLKGRKFIGPFKPLWRKVHGDARYAFIEAFWEDVDCYADDVSKGLTLYRAMSGQPRVVGVMLHFVNIAIGYDETVEAEG